MLQTIRGMNRSRKVLMAAMAGLSVSLLFLIGPVATWLQARERWVGRYGASPDAVYLVAGARDQNRRLAALDAWLTPLARDTSNRLPSPSLLVANDRAIWNPAGSAPKTRAHLAREHLALKHQAEVAIVPGRFAGTDGEMEALAAYLDRRPEFRILAIATSPFHVRRALQRLDAHLDETLELYALSAAPTLADRAPWVVAGELAKMLRDRLGLSRNPLLSRRESGTPGHHDDHQAGQLEDSLAPAGQADGR